MVRNGSRIRARLGRWTVATLAAGMVASLAAAAAPTTAAAAPGSYVALGDSYTSGPFIPLQLQPYGCLRSDHNYAHLVASSLGLALDDVSCAGATTDDMTQSQGVTPGPNPPQFDALNVSTQVVTLGIGGNDIHFSSIAESCFSTTPTGQPCQDKYGNNGQSPDVIDGYIQATAPKVAAAVQGIHARSPAAKVVVVGYPAIFPEQPLLPGAPEGCWPSLPVAPADVPYLRAKEKELNAMLATEAAANNAGFADTYTPSIGHDACEPPVIRWVEPLVPASPAAPIHPNLFGMEGMAAVVQQAIQSA